MKSIKTALLCGLFLLLLAALSWVSGQNDKKGESCLVDGTSLLPISRVSIQPPSGEVLLFCSLCCAHTWLDAHKEVLADLNSGNGGITVVDEVSGLEIDATLAYYIESDEYSRKENKCRNHVFADKQVASKYLRKTEGREQSGYLAGLGPKLSWATDFNLPDMQDMPVRLTDFRGKVVFLRFFSMKNPFVKKDFTDLQIAQKRFQNQGFTVLAVSVEDTKKDVEKLIKELNITFPVLLDPEGKVADTYQITGFPTGFLLDPSGIVDSSSIGEVTADILAPFLHALR
jgi:peroxiredoxin